MRSITSFCATAFVAVSAASANNSIKENRGYVQTLDQYVAPYQPYYDHSVTYALEPLQFWQPHNFEQPFNVQKPRYIKVSTGEHAQSHQEETQVIEEYVSPAHLEVIEHLETLGQHECDYYHMSVPIMVHEPVKAHHEETQKSAQDYYKKQSVITDTTHHEPSLHETHLNCQATVNYEASIVHHTIFPHYETLVHHHAPVMRHGFLYNAIDHENLLHHAAPVHLEALVHLTVDHARQRAISQTHHATFAPEHHASATVRHEALVHHTATTRHEAEVLHHQSPNNVVPANKLVATELHTAQKSINQLSRIATQSLPRHEMHLSCGSSMTSHHNIQFEQTDKNQSSQQPFHLLKSQNLSKNNNQFAQQLHAHRNTFNNVLFIISLVLLANSTKCLMKRKTRISWHRLAQLMFTLLCGVAMAEEESILTGATVSFTKGAVWAEVSPALDEFIHGNFKSYIHSNNSSAKVHITVDLKYPMKVVSIMLVNRADLVDYQIKIGDSDFRLGNELDTDLNNVIVQGVTDGGLFDVPNAPEGRYLTIGRDTTSPADDDYYHLDSLRAYQTPNLLKINEASVGITSDSTHSEAGFEANNLIQNLDKRSGGNDLYAITQADPQVLLPQHTCYKVRYETIKANSNNLVIGFDLGKPFFVHAVLHVQDLLTDHYPYFNSDLIEFLQNYELYIGNSSKYQENQKCAGGPFLDPTDRNTYVHHQRSFILNEQPFPDQNVGMTWPLGKENWCNLEGQFVHFVADQSQQVATANDSDTVSVCQVGIYGTEYVRNGDQVPDSVDIIQGESMTLTISRIESSLTIGNDLQIALRQSSNLSFVSIVESTNYSEVTIDTANQQGGEYSLVLESFNMLSIAKSALKTDTVTIKVIVVLPKLSAKTLTAGSPETWKSPLKDFLAENNQWSAQPLIPQQLEAYVSYDERAQEFEFNGDENSGQLASQFLYIAYTVSNNYGDESNLTQTISVKQSENMLLEEQQVQVSDEEEKQEQANQEDLQTIQNIEEEVNHAPNETEPEQTEDKESEATTEKTKKEEPQIASEYSDEVFDYVPLDERLGLGADNDIGSFYASILKQRELAKQAVASSASRSSSEPLPPEIRLGTISANQNVQIEFTNPMQFPSMSEFIELNKDLELIDVRMLSGSEDGGLSANLVSWKIASIEPTQINIELEFQQPLEVSQGEEPDKIVIQAGLSEYPDENNQKLPPSVMRVKDIPLQFASASAAETAESMSKSASNAVKASGSVHSIITIILQASLQQLWSLINSQQNANSLPMQEKLKIPAQSMTITKEMLKISNFDLLPTDWLSEIIWDYWPEDDSYSLNFESVGVESTLFLQNIGLNFYIVILTIAIGMLHVILLPLRSVCGCVQKLTNRIENYLYFNGTIRFSIEIFLDICLMASLNLFTVDWDSPFYTVKASNYIAIGFIFLVCSILFISILASCLKPSMWVDEKFEKRIGQSIFEGTKRQMQLRGQRSLLFLPIMFLMRRVIFVIIVLQYREVVWLQIAMQVQISLVMIIYLQWYRPFEENAQTNIETLNEATMVMLSYFLICFTDFVPKAETRNDMGLYYSGITLSNITVHIVIMMLSIFVKVRLSLLKCKYRRRMSKMANQRQQKNQSHSSSENKIELKLTSHHAASNNSSSEAQLQQRQHLHTIVESPAEDKQQDSFRLVAIEPQTNQMKIPIHLYQQNQEQSQNISSLDIEEEEKEGEKMVVIENDDILNLWDQVMKNYGIKEEDDNMTLGNQQKNMSNTIRNQYKAAFVLK